jgi:phospholipase/carboxylesterase
MLQASNLSESYILDLLKTLTKKYKINSIYLMGFSQGAIFTYQIGIRNPHCFKGIICLSGPGLLEPLILPFSNKKITDWLEEKNIAGAKRLRVFIGHGKNDKSPDYNMGLKSRDTLKKYGYDVTFYSFDGKHEIVKEELEHVINWLKKKKKTINLVFNANMSYVKI